MLFNHRINSDQAETLYVISQALTPYLESIVRGLSCSLARPFSFSKSRFSLVSKALKPLLLCYMGYLKKRGFGTLWAGLDLA